MTDMHMLGPKEVEIVRLVETEIFTAMMERFGNLWASDYGAPSADPEVIRAMRRAYAAPIMLGAIRAVAHFTWATAPVGGELAGLMESLEQNSELAAIAAQAAAPAGSFWLNVADHLAGSKPAP